MLAAVAAELETQIAVIVEDMAPGLLAAEPGIGPLSAAQILLSWSHAGRIRTEAAFAMLSGTAHSVCCSPLAEHARRRNRRCSRVGTVAL